MSFNDLPPLLCPDDEAFLVIVADKNMDPALQCMLCKTIYHPGTEVWDAMNRNLDDRN